MNDVLEFLEHYTIDQHIYCCIPLVGRELSQSERVEVYWERAESSRSCAWKLTRTVDAAEVRCTRQEVYTQLARLGADVQEFDRQMRVSALTQVCFAESMRIEALKVFGAEEVAQALSDHREFLSELRRTVLELTRKPLRLIPGEASNDEPKAPRASTPPPSLRLVSGG